MIMFESAPLSRVKVPAWQYLLVVLVVAVSIAYTVACVIAVTAVASLRSIAAQLLAGQHPDPITLQARLRAVSHTHSVVTDLGLLLFFSFIAWLVLLGRRYRAAGHRPPIDRRVASVWIAAWIVSSILSAADSLGFAGIRTVADVHRAATVDMTFLIVRAAVGIVYAWCALALLAARRRWVPPAPPLVAGSDLSYEEYVAMRTAQRAEPPASPTTPAAIPPSASASEMTLDAPNG